jgi:hypothetical protein
MISAEESAPPTDAQTYGFPRIQTKVHKNCVFSPSLFFELDMEVFVCKGYSGQIFRVNVNEHLPVNDVIPVIAASLGFYTSNEDRVGMYNLTRDWEYLPHDSLLSRGTHSGDLIILADGGGCHKHE